MLNMYLVLLSSTAIFTKVQTQNCEIKIRENTRENVFLLNLNSVKHQGYNSHGMKYFNLLRGNVSSLFQLKTSGELYTATIIDRDGLCQQMDKCCENKKTCRVSIMVATSSSSTESPRTFDCSIEIEDENDNTPTFPQDKLNISIKESDQIGSLYPLPLATDNDSDEFSVKGYKLIEELKFPPPFSLEHLRQAENLNLRLDQMLDREKRANYEFKLIAFDGGNPSRSGTLLIEIHVLDVNDNSPQLSRTQFTASQKENEFSKRELLTIDATDADEKDNAELYFKIVNENPSLSDANKYFKVEHGSGKLFLKKTLDYEKYESHRFFVEVFNKNGNIKTATATVQITVENVNDEKPEISVNYLNGKKDNADILENADKGIFVALATVSDRDKGIGGQVSCKLLGFDEVFELHIDDASKFPNQYRILTKISLDREKKPSYNVSMECEDKGIPILKTKVEIFVRVKDQNDNIPIIKIDKNIHVRENLPIRFIVTKIRASDEDVGVNGEVIFSISDSDEHTKSMLEIDAVSGEIRTRKIIDREMEYDPLKVLPVVLTVSDKGRPSLSSSLSFTIKVEDENDNAPVFASDLLQFSITENEQPRHTLGEIPISDKDDQSQLRVTLQSSYHRSNPFTIFRRDNKFFLNTTRSLDWEKEKSFSMKVIATDGIKSHTTTASINVVVGDENDNSPMIIFPTQKNFTSQRLSYQENSGFTILTVSATDKDSSDTNNGKFSFHLSENKDLFMIDSNSGAIKTCRKMSRTDVGRFGVKVVVRDHGLPSRESSITIFIEVDDSKPQLQNENDKEDDEMSATQTTNYLWTKEGFLVISLIILILFLLFCVLTILYVRHIKGLFPALPDIFLACGSASLNRKCTKSSAREKSTYLDPILQSSSLDFQHTVQGHPEKSSSYFYLNQNDFSTKNTNCSSEHRQSLSPYLPYETMKSQPHSAANHGPKDEYNYGKLFYFPTTVRCDVAFQRPYSNTANNNIVYESRAMAIPTSINQNLPLCRRIINNIEDCPPPSDSNIKDSFNERFSSDPCLKIIDAERIAGNKSVINTPDLRRHARALEKIDTYAITYPLEQSTFV